MDEFEERAGRILVRINELAGYSEDLRCLTRTFGSPAFMEAGKKVFLWMTEAGLQTSIDNIGNIRGRLVSTDKNAQTFIIASHIDTVSDAGKFDGPLGVIMGLDLVEHLIKSKTVIPFNIELIAFSDEEGVRFHSTYLGSRVVAGTFDIGLLDKKDASGISVKEVVEFVGGDAGKIRDDAISPQDVTGYFEIHIEQGPVLYERNIPAAIVTAIAGQRRIELHFQGLAGHAGTVPMNMRNDALCAAAECILQIEGIAIAQKNKVVATVGKIAIRNAASNVIPGDVTCSLDIRSEDETILEAAMEKLKQVCETVCKNRAINFEWKLIQSTKPVACDVRMNQLLEEAISDSGYEVLTLVSGAGHDAVAISAIAPVAMMFVRCYKGISHNPLENVALDDIKASLIIAEKFILKYISKYNA